MKSSALKSSLFNHLVVPVPGKTFASIRLQAEHFLLRHAPAMLHSPRPLDIPHLIDKVLHHLGIFVSPCDPKELNDFYGLTRLTDDDEIHLLLPDHLYTALYEGGSNELFARTTFGHELGHACMHLPMLREQRQQRMAAGLKPIDIAAALQRRADIKPYQDPEWQAWVWAGSVLIPPKTLQQLAPSSVIDAAKIYNVSRQMMTSWTARLEKNNIPIFPQIH